MSTSKYDVFLCHNSKDKDVVRAVDSVLKDFKIKTWLDEVDLRPGRSWKPEIHELITTVRSIAIFIGENGFGSYQEKEIEDVLLQFSSKDRPIIPVLLPNTEPPGTIPKFFKNSPYGGDLSNFTFVDLNSQNSMSRLILGINGNGIDKEQCDFAQSLYQTNYDRLKLESLPTQIEKFSRDLSALCSEYTAIQKRIQESDRQLNDIRLKRKERASESVNGLEKFLRENEDYLYKKIIRSIDKGTPTKLKEKLIKINCYDDLKLTIKTLISAIPIALLKEDGNESFDYFKLVKFLKNESLEEIWDDDEYLYDLIDIYDKIIKNIRDEVSKSYLVDISVRDNLNRVLDCFMDRFKN